MESLQRTIGWVTITSILIALITFVVFLTMKLCGAIAWSWIIVFLPIIIEVIFIALTIWITYVATYVVLNAQNSLNK